MDLATLQTADEVAVHLEHPGTGEPLYGDDGGAITISAKGADSKAFRQAAQRIQDGAGSGRRKLKPAQVEANAIKLLAEVTTGWQNIVLDGEELDYTRENAIRLYTEQPWVREQVDAAIGDRANFFGNAATS